MGCLKQRIIREYPLSTGLLFHLQNRTSLEEYPEKTGYADRTKRQKEMIALTTMPKVDIQIAKKKDLEWLVSIYCEEDLKMFSYEHGIQKWVFAVMKGTIYGCNYHD